LTITVVSPLRHVSISLEHHKRSRKVASYRKQQTRCWLSQTITGEPSPTEYRCQLSLRFGGNRQAIVKPVAVGVQRLMRRQLLMTAAFWGLKCTLIPDYTASYPKRQQPIGRVMALGINRRPLIAESGIQSQASSCESFGRKSEGTTGFSSGILAFPCQYRSMNVPSLIIHISPRRSESRPRAVHVDVWVDEVAMG